MQGESTNAETGFTTVLVYEKWPSYERLQEWTKKTYPRAELSRHIGGRDLAVLLFPWPTGVRRTEFVIFEKIKGVWEVLLVHKPVENEKLLVETNSLGLTIKAEQGRTLLIIPDQ